MLLQTVKRSRSPNRTKAQAPTERKGLQVEYLRVSALDHKEVRQLARNLDDLRLIVKKLTGKGVKVCFVKRT